jgi:hypothetical protein
MELQEPLDPQVQMELQEPLDPQVQMELREHLDPQVQMELREPLDPQVQMELREHLEQQVQMELREPLDPKEALAHGPLFSREYLEQEHRLQKQQLVVFGTIHPSTLLKDMPEEPTHLHPQPILHQ